MLLLSVSHKATLTENGEDPKESGNPTSEPNKYTNGFEPTNRHRRQGAAMKELEAMGIW